MSLVVFLAVSRKFRDLASVRVQTSGLVPSFVLCNDLLEFVVITFRVDVARCLA